MDTRQLALWELTSAGSERSGRPAATWPGNAVLCQPLNLPDADITYFPELFTKAESDRFFASLLHTVHWRQETVCIAGKPVPLPRLTAWYGDRPYTYSGITHPPSAWLPDLLLIKHRVEQVCQQQFNSVLLNLYRHGQDSVSWHSDDEAAFQENAAIASVSLGAIRKFMLKHTLQPSLRTSLELPHGSLLLMQGTTQKYWLHQVPKTRKAVTPRINLTFRQLV